MRVNAGIVPNFFTMTNMFCGFYATLLAAQGRIIPACWWLVAAGILDVLDGKMARLTGTSSEFGVQYDSMADVVSFGLAPAALTYFVVLKDWGIAGIFLSFVPLVLGTIRLARFNIRGDDADQSRFEGIPIPASAMTIVGFILFNYEFWGYFRWSKIFVSMMIIVSLLMITTIPYEKFPKFTLNGDRRNRIKIILTIIMLVSFIFYPETVLFPIQFLYIISGPSKLLWQLLKPQKENAFKGKNKMKVAVKVRLKESILDPQGKAVQNALSQLGFSQIANVRVGKLIELEVDDKTPSSQIKPLAEAAAKKTACESGNGRL